MSFIDKSKLANIIMNDICDTDKCDHNHRKLVAIYIVFTLAIAIFAFFTIFNFIVGNYPLALFDLFFLVLSFIGLYKLNKDKNIYLFSIISSVFSFIAIIGALAVSQGENYVIFYSVLFPLLSMQLLGRKVALYLTILLFILINIITVPHLGEHITIEEYMRFVTIYIIVTAIIYLFESTIVNILKKLHNYIEIIDKNIISSTTDLDGNITNVSEAFCNISGYKREELVGKNHNIVRHPDTKKEVFEDLWDTISKDEIWTGEIKNKKKDGGYYWVKAVISPMKNTAGKKIGYTAVRHNITDQKLIEELSVTDSLTNIYNRRQFTNTFPKIINSAKRQNELVSFLIMDIDHFKQYNDTYGHKMGDDVLIKVASTIQNTLKRGDDFCFRLGGEEFGVIFKVDEKVQAEVFANIIRTNIESLQIEHKKNSASSFITVSMGLMCKKAKDIKDTDEMYRDADKLLYEAKNKGKNRVISN